MVLRAVQWLLSTRKVCSDNRSYLYDEKAVCGEIALLFLLTCEDHDPRRYLMYRGSSHCGMNFKSWRIGNSCAGQNSIALSKY